MRTKLWCTKLWSLALLRAFGLLLVIVASAPAGAQFETAKILPPEESQFFGRLIALDGTSMLVPSYFGVYAYRFDEGEWAFETFIDPSIASVGDIALGRGGELAVIGVPYEEVSGPRVGAAYIYVRGGPDGDWELEAVLLPEAVEPESYLGERVAVGGVPGAETVVLGGFRYDYDDPLNRRGAAHVFRRDPASGTWADEGPLWAEGVTEPDLFGAAVAATGDLVLVGAPRTGWDCEPAEGPCPLAAAYLFRRAEGAGGEAAWAEEARWLDVFDYSVEPPVEGVGNYGEGVALSPAEGLPGVEAVAALGDIQGGAVLVFERRGGVWAATDTVDAHGGGNFDRNYGMVLDPSGTRLVVGASGWNRGTFEVSVGRVEIFEREPDGRWRFAGARYASDGEGNDHLGADVALSGEVIAAGAPLDDNEAGNGAGAVYVFGAPPVSAEPEASAERGVALAAWPNPARGAATVALSLGRPAQARVAAYDVLGRRVTALHEGPLPAGTHRLRFDTSALPTGVYLVVAEVAGTRVATRLTVAR